MKLRNFGFVSLALFASISAAYVAGKIALELGLGIDWAAPISGLVFAAVVLTIDRKSTHED